jgi:hypothetical protein
MILGGAKMINVTFNDLSYKQSDNAKLMDRFANSGLDICEIKYDESKYPEINKLSGSLTSSAKRYGYLHIRAIVYHDKLYLLNRLKG